MRMPSPVLTVSLALLLFGNIAALHADHARLLLVTGAENKMNPLDKNELRRLFLGMPVYRSGEMLKPLVNKTDERCYQIFLQSVIGMSQKRYERTLVLGVYRQGYRSPPVYTQLEELQAELKNNPDGVSFIYDQGQFKDVPFNVVQEIWISDRE